MFKCGVNSMSKQFNNKSIDFKVKISDYYQQ